MEDNSQIAGLRLRELSLKDLTFHTECWFTALDNEKWTIN